MNEMYAVANRIYTDFTLATDPASTVLQGELKNSESVRRQFVSCRDGFGGGGERSALDRSAT